MLLTTYFGHVLNNTMTSEAADVITATDDASMTSSAVADGSEMAWRTLLQSMTSLAMTETTTAAAAAAVDDEAAYLFIRQQVNWYTVIAILSALVLVGMCFTICRLMMKANAHEKAGEGWTRDSLLYSRKDSIIPISLHFDQTEDNFY